MLEYKSLNGIKWNSMKIKCFNSLRQAIQHYISDMHKLFASTPFHWKWHQNVNVPMKFISLKQHCYSCKPCFSTFFFWFLLIEYGSQLQKKAPLLCSWLSKLTMITIHTFIFFFPFQLLSKQWSGLFKWHPF